MSHDPNLNYRELIWNCRNMSLSYGKEQSKIISVMGIFDILGFFTNTIKDLIGINLKPDFIINLTLIFFLILLLKAFSIVLYRNATNKLRLIFPADVISIIAGYSSLNLLVVLTMVAYISNPTISVVWISVIIIILVCFFVVFTWFELHKIIDFIRRQKRYCINPPYEGKSLIAAPPEYVICKNCKNCVRFAYKCKCCKEILLYDTTCSYESNC